MTRTEILIVLAIIAVVIVIALAWSAGPRVTTIVRRRKREDEDA